jgi:tetratricopeptide (TPR) repeat protein
MRDPLLRLVGALLVLSFYAWAAFAPRRDSGPSPEELRLLAEESRTLYYAGRHADALAPTLTLHAAYPANLVYLKQLATIYGELGRSEPEAAAWESFVASSPTPQEACPQIGNAYYRLQLVDKSVDAFERCLAFEPSDPDGVFYLARAHEWNGNVPRARMLYERGLALAASYHGMRLGLAGLDLREGRLQQARESAAVVLALEPENVDALLIVGLAYQREGNMDRARAALERGIRLAPDHDDFDTALGLVAEAQGRNDAAKTHYTTALARNPKDRDAQARLKRISVLVERP